jgi:hypothetical protein
LVEGKRKDECSERALALLGEDVVNLTFFSYFAAVHRNGGEGNTKYVGSTILDMKHYKVLRTIVQIDYGVLSWW